MPDPGLCGSCQHVARTVTKRGSLFFRCRLAETDTTLRKYPPLPVLQCHGYSPGSTPAMEDEHASGAVAFGRRHC